MAGPALTSIALGVARAGAPRVAGGRSRRRRSCTAASCVTCVGCLLAPLFLGFVVAAGLLSARAEGSVAAGAVPISCPRGTVSQGFGNTPWEHPHRGIDLVCPPGTPVLAVVSGVFHRLSDLRGPCPFFPGRRGGYGTYGVLTAADGTEFFYAHLSSYEAADGAFVLPQSVLGYEGSTGCSTGSHLHFEVRLAGRAVNPCPYLPDGFPDLHEAGGRCWGHAKP